MSVDFDCTVIWTNMTYFLVGRFPHGPLGGIALTLYLALVACLLSFIGGIILGMMNVSSYKPLKYLSLALVNAIRGIPLIMVIFWMYFLLPAFLGRTVAENWTVILALTLFTSAYMSQIVKAGVESVPKGQTEAALSTGLSPRQVMLFIVLPQGLRNMIPSFVNQFVSLIKDTSLAFIVGVSELTQVATQINNRTIIYPTEIFMFIAAVYFVMCFTFTSLSRRLEKRLAWKL
jgi:polar amino acid transport system permease protein